MAKDGQLVPPNQAGREELKASYICSKLMNKGENFVLNHRKLCLGSKLYDELQNPEVRNNLRTITSSVSDRALDATVDILLQFDGINNVSQEEFIEELSKRMKKSGVYSFIKPIVLCKLIAEDPEITHRLESESSVYPHTLYENVPSRKITKDEIVEQALQQISTEIPEGLEELVAPIRNILIREKGRRPQTFIGKYTLPKSYPWRWKSDDNLEPDSKIEEELDSLWDHEEIREMYYGVMTIFRINSRIARQHNKDVSRVYKETELHISPSEYSILRGNLINYAVNQLGFQWSSQEGSKKIVNPTPLTIHTGLEWIIDDETLKVQYPHVTKEQERITLEHSFTDQETDRYLPTRRYLPLVANFINRIIRSTKQ